MRGIKLLLTHIKLLLIVFISLFFTETFAQKNRDVIIYAKLKSTTTPILQPWSTSFLSDRDLPAVMLAPKSFQHVIPQRKNSFSTFELFKKERPDILEIHFASGTNVSGKIEELKEHPLVEYVELETYYPDLEILSTYVPNDPRQGEQYVIDLHNMEEAWAINQGSDNISIGIHDSGFDVNHEDLRGNLKENTIEINGTAGIDDDNNGYIDDFYGYNFVNDNNDLTGSNHGVLVSGSASASTDNNVGIAGIGFNTKMLCSVRSSLSSLSYLAENGVKIINMSWGSPNSKSKSYEELINFYTEDPDYDVLFIAAAGNSNHGGVLTDYYPASFDNVLSVTSIDQNKNIQNYTKSYKIHLSANDNSLTTNVNNTYSTTAGTSIASPTVAGIAALVRSQDPTLTAIQTAELIRYTSDTTIFTISNNANTKYTSGFGMVDAYAALRLIDSVHVVRASNLSYNKYGTDDIDVMPGDTIEITFDFKNVLHGSSGDLKAVLTSYDDNFIPITDTTFIGQLSEGQTISNAIRPFLFKVGLNADLDENISFRINYTDSTDTYHYKDWQNVELNITLEQYVNFNKINGIFRPDGTIGKDNGLNYYTANNFGVFNYYQFTRQAGIILATNDGTVSNAVYTDINTNTRSEDFQGITPVSFIYDHAIDTNYPVISFEMQYVDINSDDPIDLEIHQTYFSTNQIDVNSEFFTELEITNTSNSHIDTLYTGLFMDWMMNYTASTSTNYPSDSSITAYDPAKKMAYVKHLNDRKYGAITLLNDAEINIQAIDNLNGANSDIDITDGFSEHEKYLAVSSGIGTTVVGNIPSGTNSSSIVSMTIPSIAPNETVRIGFLIIAADSIEQLYSQVDSIRPYTQYWLKSPNPDIGYQVAHEGEYVPIRTSDFDSLALFKNENGTKVLKERGRIFSVLIDSIDYYYVQSQGRYVYNGDTIQLEGEAIPELSITSPMYVCDNSNVIVQANGCGIFNYYSDELLTDLLYSGPSLTLYDIERDTSFYISCANRTGGNVQYVYSEIVVDSVFKDYYLSDTLSYVSDSVHAEFQARTGAVAWQWYLNGEQVGEDNEASITIEFEEAGDHQLRLFATNRAGCTYIISKEIDVKRDNLTSSMVSLLENSIVYPNPVVNHQVFLKLPTTIGTMNFELYDIDGQLIRSQLSHSKNAGTYTIYLPSKLSSKMYLLRGTSQFGNKTWQITIR